MKLLLAAYRSALLLLLCLPCLVQAQQEPVVTSFSFYVLGWDTSADLQYTQGSALQDISVTQSLITGPYRYTGPSPLQFFSKRTDTEGLAQPALEASIDASGSPTPLLLVFLKQEGAGQSPYRIFAVRDAIVPQRDNEVAVINFSDRNVGGKLNELSFTSAPGGVQVLKTIPGVNNNIAFHLASHEESGWKHAMSTVWGERPGIQNFIFIINNPRRPDQLQVKRLRLNRAALIEQSAP